MVLDGMALKQQIRRMGNEIIGYTDCGGVLPEVDDKHQLAKESLIYLVVGVNVPFKLQFGYFLINSLTGKLWRKLCVSWPQGKKRSEQPNSRSQT